VPLDWVSGGNSSSLPLLLAGRMPEGVNNLRIGEAILQGGRDTFLDEPWPALDRDAFLLSSELLEVKLKPSMPIGKSGLDAFGQKPKFTDEGDRLRGIANIGREDVIVEGLEPINGGMRVLGASSDHLVVDLTDADPPLKVGDMIQFRMNYGALLAVMTSEYVEKVPVQDIKEKTSRKSISFVLESGLGDPFAAESLPSRLAAIGLEVSGEADSATVRVDIGCDRRVALTAMRAAAGRHESLGLIWIDSRASLMPDGRPQATADEAVLTNILQELPPKLSPECVVLVGLREASPTEAAALKASRMTLFTIADIDARGMRDVMHQAIRIASAGTHGIHVSYSPTVTDMPGWADGAGGITVRETHQAMEAIAEQGRMTSFSLSSLTTGCAVRVVHECAGFLMSALGKQIL
jgi:arginase family enzyme